MLDLLETIKYESQEIKFNYNGKEYSCYPHNIQIDFLSTKIYLTLGSTKIELYNGLEYTFTDELGLSDLAHSGNTDVSYLYRLFVKQSCKTKAPYLNCKYLKGFMTKMYSYDSLVDAKVLDTELYNFDYHRLKFELELYTDLVTNTAREGWFEEKNEKQIFLKYSENDIPLVLPKSLGFRKSTKTNITSDVNTMNLFGTASNTASSKINSYLEYLGNHSLEEAYELKFMNLPEYISYNSLDNYAWSTAKEIEVRVMFSSKLRTTFCHSRKDRVLQSSITNYLNYKFGKELHKSCFSYQSGLSTLDAMKYLTKKDVQSKYGVKVDISKYFDSVPKEFIDNMIEYLSKDDKLLNELLVNLYKQDSYIDLNKKKITKYLSLIQGCSIATFLGNFLLKDLDIIMSKDTENCYARYCDDIIIFRDTPEELEASLGLLKITLDSFGLSFNPDKSTYYQPYDEFEFLGLIFKRDGRFEMGDKTFTRTKKHIKYFCKRYKDKPQCLEKAIKRINKYFFDEVEEQSSWGLYVFRNITSIERLRELDFYLVNTLRQMYTGKNNFANINKVPMEMLQEKGLLSFVELYQDFKYDFDYYNWKVKTCIK